ncbi:T9SS type A sorting domain-containing protein [Neolewinella aurantiaca]|uniref:T9SS type A sorting domain-containing protein n=1 Tax=Neolewinella aurantiaca TaxID=2602767 RepID=A0A5C7FFA8_9BACT|nr:right-handed parallel beta-helix repeat-containing protein [Neolewinella aurantiaca]TXF88247.1 T9SS type A sorting domain-containing protein [Neolewinella aurantiaca]
MRSLIFLLAAFCLAGLNAQTIYVDIDSPTPGDGTSWATAYSDLNQALLDAPAGAEVWIAAGTYVTPDTASFYIDKELTVLGGFAGTETSADAADPEANPTILSGDVLGNDGEMGFDSTLYVDNNRVLFVTDTTDDGAYTVTLDGFSIVHGGISTEIGSFNEDAGAGLRTYAKLNASRLKFSRNYGRNGSALFIRFRSTNGSVFDDVEFSNNFTFVNRAIYIRDNIGIEFKNSTFIGEGTAAAGGSGMVRCFNTIGHKFTDCEFTDIWSTSSGGGLALSGADSTLVEGCTFTNCRSDGWGGGIANFNTSLFVRNSTFEQNMCVRNGAAIYQQTTDDVDVEVELDGCTFNENDGGAFGGALGFLGFDTSVFETTINNCVFTDNTSSEGGRGAVCYIQGNNNPITLTNSILEGNVCEGGTFVNNADGSLTVRNTQFLENGNTSTAGRGALVGYMATGEPLIIDSCRFEDNQVTAVSGYFSAGAAVYLFGGDEATPMPVTITNTQFLNNAASDVDNAGGGALYLSRGCDVMIDNCNFDGNTSGSIGGAIHARTFEGPRDTSATGEISVTFIPFTGKITNSRFVNNFASGQGGAIGTFRAAFDVTNSLFVNNQLAAEGASGGAIIFNGVTPFFSSEDGSLQFAGNLALTSTMINNTFVNNLKGDDPNASGNDIALFQQSDSEGLNNSSLSLTLLNNAFIQSEQEASIEIEPGEADGSIIPVGEINITSLGGNFYNNESDEDLGLISDSDMLDLSIDDANAVADLFIDIFDDEGEGVNAQLAIPENLEDNPLINSAVVSDLLPSTDIEGNPRGDFPDIGAYETDQGAVSTGEPLANSGLEISFFPNPTKDVLNVRNDEASIERFTLLVSDQNGRVLKARQFNGATNSIDLATVPAGVYNLQLVVNGKIYGQQIIKQ